MKKYFLLTQAIALLFLVSCNRPEAKTPATGLDQNGNVMHPKFIENAIVYEVNVRQFSQAGTFAGVEEALPRLKELGIDILWLMPVHPIGEVNRKGSLGSYYSVKDYYGINPEFGNMDDFKRLVNKTHEAGMKLIIDWVPNHSAWDNPLSTEHPEWYLKNEDQTFKSPFDWTDVIQFDYTQRGLRDYMIQVMSWWVKETDIDGFRCDVAHMVPVDFWNELRPALFSIKEVFLLAEADQPFLHEKAFDATYDWKFHHIMNEMAKGTMNALNAEKHFMYVDSVYPPNSILLQFTSNHDENSWNGTEFERYGDAYRMYAVMSFTVPGMPLIYNGQESCLKKRLLFFEKDPIDWTECDMYPFYQKLIKLRKSNIALWSGPANGGLERIQTNQGDKVFAFRRVKDYNRVICVFNLTGETLNCKLDVDDGLLLHEYFMSQKFEDIAKEIFILEPFDFMVFVQE